MSECIAEEDTVTVQDAVYEMEAQVEESIAVLGASDSENCTYSLGYMERQALFSCKTCNPKGENKAGICYACSLVCHREHELIELYTKRNVRCDCGNSNFNGFTCSLFKDKDPLNEKNSYNHNYKGVYCTCERPYPDPEDEIEDEMIQCIICEDWFHSRHLVSLPPAEYHEMTCHLCAAKNIFLQYYYNEQVKKMESDLDVISVDADSALKTDKSNTDNEKSGAIITKNKNVPKDEKPAVNCGSLLAPEICRLEKLKIDFADTVIKKESLYWTDDGWRNSLCRCCKCLDLYEKNNLTFIIKESDTMSFYEQRGKERAEKVLNDAANTISSMPIVQQVELARGYNELKSSLQDFLRGFQQNQVVKKEDIENFFEELNERKRRRLAYLPPENCR